MMPPTNQRVHVALITSISAPHDAISNVFRQNYLDLSSVDEIKITLFARNNAVEELPVHELIDVGDLLIHPDFLSADVLIFHFGIYYDLFDAILIGNGHAKVIVIFHNITQKQYLDEKHHEVIDRSLEQAHNISVADDVWADSDVNRRVLLSLGVESARIGIVPLAVPFPAIEASPMERRQGSFQLLFVGRAVRSKGILEAVDAVKSAVDRGCSVSFTIAGNLGLSDVDYLEHCKARVKAYGLEGIVNFVGTVSSSELASLYRASHILMICSYHEGFCIPVVEGLRAGCIPVGFAAGNVPTVAHRLGRLVGTGDEVALSSALIEVLDDLESIRNGQGNGVRLDRGYTSLEEFETLRRDAVALYEPLTLRTRKVEKIMRLAAQNTASQL